MTSAACLREQGRGADIVGGERDAAEDSRDTVDVKIEDSSMHIVVLVIALLALFI